MQAEDGIGAGIGEGPLLDHQPGTAQRLARRGAFLGGLEDEDDGAGNVLAHAGQHLGGPHQHGDMGVVATGMGHRHRAAHIGPGRG